MTFGGLMTALVTPFCDGKLDEGAFRSLVRRQMEGGVDGLVPCGTTGEAPTLSAEEHLQVVQWTQEEAKGKVPVLAGIGSNNTALAIHTAKAVERLGAKGVLATAPYYNKPSQEGLYQHFKAIAEAISIEICLYDVPGRSVVHIEPKTVERLSHIPNITCIKDATADLANASEILRLCGDKMTLLSGDDFTTLPFIAQGGAGCISVTANLVPKTMRKMVAAILGGELHTAREIHLELFPLSKALFMESNPIPAKAAMAAMGLLVEELRLPLTAMDDGKKSVLLATLREMNLLDS